MDMSNESGGVGGGKLNGELSSGWRSKRKREYTVITVRVLAGSERNNTGEENIFEESTSEIEGPSA